jgi:hypothetical protein
MGVTVLFNWLKLLSLQKRSPWVAIQTHNSKQTQLKSAILFNLYTYMLEMAFCTFFSSTHNIYTLFKKSIQSLLGIFFIKSLIMLNKHLRFYKELFNWV